MLNMPALCGLFIARRKHIPRRCRRHPFASLASTGASYAAAPHHFLDFFRRFCPISTRTASWERTYDQ